MAKFKAGDTVEAIDSAAGQFTKGSRYTVSEHSSYDVVSVEKDDKGSTTNGWSASKFKLVTRPAAPSPIRTRREIVPGVYGLIEVGGVKDGRIFIRVGGDAYKADDIREIIHIASQVLEVLEENAG